MRIAIQPATFDDVDVLVWVRATDSPTLADDFRHDALEQVRGEIEKQHHLRDSRR